MIRFVMIDLKLFEFDFEKYTDELMNNIKESLNSKKLSFYDTEETKRSCYLVLSKKEYFIDFIFIHAEGRFQLKIDIQTREKEFADQELHNLKIMIKDLLVEDWKQCVWLTDHQSEEFAEDLYKNIHSVENSLRRLINTVLSHHLGGDWWQLMPTHLTNKYSKRIIGYQAKAPSFKNVHAHLLSIDTDDLTNILEFKTYTMKNQSMFSELDPFSPESLNPYQELGEFKYMMSDIINNHKSIESHQKSLTKLLEEQMEVEKDFWEEYFSPWLSCTLREFSGKWRNFSNDRNHVAHNKLIDDKLYEKFKKSMEDLLEIISGAEENFEKYLKDASTQFLEFIKENELEKSYLEQRQEEKFFAEEAGIEVLDTDEIISIFQEHITETFESIYHEIYYRTDIEVTYDEPLFTEHEKIFEIEGNILKRSIHVDIIAEIDETVGFTSTVDFLVYDNDKLEGSFKIDYINGEAEYDEDQEIYLPKTKNELDISSLSKVESLIYKLLEDEIPEVSKDDFASFVCEECRELTVNLSEDNNHGLGICMNCGHKNTFGMCPCCYTILDERQDSLCENCIENNLENE
ncbi:hypothetical protein [Bacillus toyonensis]|uniref:hypothetical protein n=1 Tax=Bacillus toyonensis TaxID=155322 RepID=UPI000BEE50E8|nr:hypothetical protein [Bacillus toyonensis]PEA69015.1 hypothetical protein COO00_29775 [Bacillus toyonensis]PEE32120.1 hypothetical protein CON98_00145 [Bacillus toyonensis]PFX78390.1 hypothetical protein COL38_23225 [Bacillus toyonensis]PGB20584.1 hypothetical protein COL98_09870 [Bacillus toyonensis]